MDYFRKSPLLFAWYEIREYVQNMYFIPSHEGRYPEHDIFRPIVIDIDARDFGDTLNPSLTFHANVLFFSPCNRLEFLMLVIFLVSILLEIAIEESEHVCAHLVVPAHQQLVFNSLSEFLRLHLLKRTRVNCQQQDQRKR